jgi:predicted CoA-substrate-specific enzyme activase
MSVAAIGIDLGYLYAKAVALSSDGEVCFKAYLPHGGKFGSVVARLLNDCQAKADTPVLLSGSESRRWELHDGDWLHEAQALTHAITLAGEPVRAILHIGASGVALIGLDDGGHLAAYETNTLCAAGTGSFLDEQAERLGIEYGQAVQLSDEVAVPDIATRCTVFAKSDLIHRQQEGFSREAMWAGLCRGMTTTLFQTLLKGRELPGRTVITGGVAQNEFVLAAARDQHPGLVEAATDGHLAVALGAARRATQGAGPLTAGALRARLDSLTQDDGTMARHEPLLLAKSTYPSFEVARESVDSEGNEIRLSAIPTGAALAGWLGLDVGSTSTKLAVLNDDGEVVCDIYRRTLGEPIVATQKALRALDNLWQELGIAFSVRGLAATGSGRKLVGKVFGADVIINEITAHARGATATADASIETIFEIGGQDAKYIRIHKGQISDSNMNFVCSAGTGSFVEEQARKLGFAVQEVGEVTAGIAPPATSDRCTVFMEQDVVKLLAAGFTREEAMGGVLYSVVKNYLNKVVGNRPISKRRVVFQGATARNRGLVAAFEKLLGVEVIVSPHCHVMGSIGAALLAQERVHQASRFIGFDQLDRPVTIEMSRCELCTNVCKITHARVAGQEETISWGYLCGREADGPARPMRHDRAFRVLNSMLRKAVADCNRSAVQERLTLGLPYSLSTHGLLPFWTSFCQSLGIALRVDKETDETVKQAGRQLAAADFCFPVKAHLGHLRRILKDPEVDAALVPYFISEAKNNYTSNSVVCPYVESSPSLFKAVATPAEAARMVAPVLDFRWSESKQAKELHEAFVTVLPNLTLAQTRQALRAARTGYADFYAQAVARGAELLAEWEAAGEAAVVFVGRPYNVRDQGLNLALPRHFAQHGLHVLPHEMLPFRPELLGTEFRNVFWTYGQRILSALRQVGSASNLYAVFLSNFNCGPDSFLLTYAEEIMKDKPFLVLELDEHGSEGGYLTRIEAFLDVVKTAGPRTSERTIRVLRPDKDEFSKRKVWFPPMHPVTARLFAAAFRHFGRDAESMPVEDQAAFERGRAAVRGSECLPTCSTVGQFLRLMEERQLDPSKQAFFMATANGPCRFGQYELLHRMVLDQAGYHDVPIMSPSSFNSYQGIGEDVRRLGWKGFVIADILYKARCKVAPYEMEAGAAEAMLERWVKRFEAAFEKGEKLAPLLRQSMAEFAAVPMRRERKPLVGIVGEIYVRCNPFTNDDLVRSIERFGGEAWLAPVTEWFLYTAQNQAWFAQEGLNGLAARGLSVLKNRFMMKDEKHWYQVAGGFMADRHEPAMADVLREGMPHIPLNFEGEAIITIGRAVLFAKQDKADMVVNAAPFGCMPGTLTTAIMRKLQDELEIPVVGMFYDGTPGLNKTLEPFIESIRQRHRRTSREGRGQQQQA